MPLYLNRSINSFHGIKAASQFAPQNERAFEGTFMYLKSYQARILFDSEPNTETGFTLEAGWNFQLNYLQCRCMH